MPSPRSERRRPGGASTPPRRDSMFGMYAGGGVLILIIIGVFAFMHWQQQNSVAQAYATPTPAASAASTAHAIQLADGDKLGTAMIAPGAYKFTADTKRGGLGQTIDGIQCGSEVVTIHVHSHLAIFYHGKQVQVPAGIGFGQPLPQAPEYPCLYWLHTHAPDGIIHVESPVLAPEGSAGFDLGMLFDEWGQPLSSSDVAGLNGPVTAYLNGAPYTGDLRLIPLRAHQQIVLEVGKPTVPPPNYAFPPND